VPLKVRDRWQIALYVPEDLKKKIKAEARRQRRSNSATVIEILLRYFAEQESKIPLAKETDADRQSTTTTQ
jgi:plasmid stability protein